MNPKYSIVIHGDKIFGEYYANSMQEVNIVLGAFACDTTLHSCNVAVYDRHKSDGENMFPASQWMSLKLTYCKY